MKNPGTIQFLLNGSPVQIDFHNSPHLSPTTTLLQYLRTSPELTGTKEGCAEGDCGACTIVMVAPGLDNQHLVKAVDSCLIFLPMIHRKAIFTVEYLGAKDLHPVQGAMVKFDGSQCGYCTPGFIMSMYALHQNHQNPSRETIMDALTGNLCRCTGYQSILTAAFHAGKGTNDDEVIKQACQQINQWPQSSLSIVTGSQKYFQPINLTELLKLRSMYPHAILIHGATDIALKVTKNHEWLDQIIDLSQVSELSQVQEGEEKTSFGAGLCLEEVKQLSKDLFPALHDCLEVFGSLQIRNLATLGGNIASASPIGDTLPVLMAYGATVTLANTHGQREIPVTDFITGYRETCLEDDEILVNISIPSAHKNHLVKWYKISKRKDLDISSVSGGFFLSLDQNQVQNIKLYYGGLAAQTKLASNTVDFLINQPWTRETIRAATPLLEKDFIPISDARADAESRMIMAKNLLLKLWSETSAEN